MVAGSDEGRRASLTKTPKKINHPADNDCEGGCPDKETEPPAFIEVASNGADHSTNHSRD